jgi:hypothetical protein
MGLSLERRSALLRPLKRSPIMLTNSDGKPWTSDGFRASWRKACAATESSVPRGGTTFRAMATL